MLLKLHSENAPFPILFTLLGINVFLQPPINLLVEVSIIALQLFLESYTVLFLSITILSNEPQLQNAFEPILVTLSGIVILVNEQPEKAL